MCPVVLPHVYDLAGLLRSTEGGLHDSLGPTYEGDDGAVGGLAGVHIEEADTFHRLYLVCNLLDDTHVAPLAEIGHALNNRIAHSN